MTLLKGRSFEEITHPYDGLAGYRGVLHNTATAVGVEVRIAMSSTYLRLYQTAERISEDTDLIKINLDNATFLERDLAQLLTDRSTDAFVLFNHFFEDFEYGRIFYHHPKHAAVKLALNKSFVYNAYLLKSRLGYYQRSCDRTAITSNSWLVENELLGIVRKWIDYVIADRYTELIPMQHPTSFFLTPDVELDHVERLLKKII